MVVDDSLLPFAGAAAEANDQPPSPVATPRQEPPSFALPSTASHSASQPNSLPAPHAASQPAAQPAAQPASAAASTGQPASNPHIAPSSSPIIHERSQPRQDAHHAATASMGRNRTGSLDPPIYFLVKRSPLEKLGNEFSETVPTVASVPHTTLWGRRLQIPMQEIKCLQGQVGEPEHPCSRQQPPWDVWDLPVVSADSHPPYQSSRAGRQEMGSGGAGLGPRP